MPGFTPKNWIDEADHAGPAAAPPGTPLSAAGIEDVELRLSDYTDSLAGTTAGIYNIRDYGATPGTADSTSAFNTAINTCGSAGGGLVFVPPSGTALADSYLINGTISITQDGISLRGGGYASYIRKGTADNSDVIRIDGAANFEVAHLRVCHASQTSGSTAFGIRVTGAGGTASHAGWVHHNYVENVWLGIGVLDQDPTGTVNSSYDVWVTDNHLENIGNNGVGVQSYGDNITVSRNHILNYGTASTTYLGSGVEFRGATGGAICENVIEHGIPAGGGVADAVDGIRLEPINDGGSGTQVVSETIVANNVIRDVDGHGIRMFGAQKTICANNRIHDCDAHGIVIGSGPSGAAIYNLVEGNHISAANEGIRLEGVSTGWAQNNTVCDNWIYDTVNAGIDLASYCSINYLSGNHVYDAGYVGIIENADSNIYRNSFHNCRVLDSADGQPGMYIAGTETRVVDCESWDTRDPNLQTYGLTIAGAATGVRVYYGVYEPNLSGTINDLGTSTFKRL